VGAAEEQAGSAAKLLDAARDELRAAQAVEGELATLATALTRLGLRAVRALRGAGEAVERERRQGAGAESEGSEEWVDKRGEAAAAAELVQLSMDEVSCLMGRAHTKATGRGGHSGALEVLVAEVERCRQLGLGEKGKGRKDKTKEFTEKLHKVLAAFEQEVRWGEVMAATV
jgi:hypothetical protein